MNTVTSRLSVSSESYYGYIIPIQDKKIIGYKKHSHPVQVVHYIQIFSGDFRIPLSVALSDRKAKILLGTNKYLQPRMVIK